MADISPSDPQWVGPKGWSPQLLLFVEGIYEKGMGKREAAIYAGQSAVSAATQAHRWYNYSIVQSYIASLYKLDVNAHRERLWTAINKLSSLMLSPDSPKPIQLGAAVKMIDIYKDTWFKELLEQDKVVAPSASVTLNLADHLRNAVPVRTESDLEDDEDNEDVDPEE